MLGNNERDENIDGWHNWRDIRMMDLDFLEIFTIEWLHWLS